MAYSISHRAGNIAYPTSETREMNDFALATLAALGFFGTLAGILYLGLCMLAIGLGAGA